MKSDKAVLVVQAELISKGLITEVRPGKWRLTKSGNEKAMQIFNKIGRTETAIVMLAAAQAIKEA